MVRSAGEGQSNFERVRLLSIGNANRAEKNRDPMKEVLVNSRPRA